VVVGGKRPTEHYKRKEEVMMKIGGWTFDVSGVSLTMPPDLVGWVVEELLPQWASVWPLQEETMALSRFGVPSVLVRIDGVLTPDGTLGIYEIEERPAGIGIACSLNPEFKTRFRSWLKSYDWNLAVVISHRRTNHDDGIWTSSFGIPLIKDEDHPPEVPEDYALLVRAEPEEEEYWPFASRALFPIRLEGWKGYGLRLALWEPIPEDLNLLPWDEGFALKPYQGSKMRDVLLWHPSKAPGIATRTKVENMIKSGRVAYWQRWIPPEQHSFIPTNYYLIRRIYFAYSPDQGWIYLGGLWNARPNLRIHGASDAVFGSVV
jgi:hypothetical protein